MSRGFNPVFLRIVPRDQAPGADMLLPWQSVHSPFLARPRRFEPIKSEVAVIYDLIRGASIDELAPLSPAIALALLAEARSGLEDLHRHGLTHGALRSKRVRVAVSGTPVLCFGLEKSAATISEDHTALPRLILGSSFDDPILLEILDAGDDGAREVVCDRISSSIQRSKIWRSPRFEQSAGR